MIEQTAGAFPTWLAPVQVRVLPVAESCNAYAHKVTDLLRDRLVRAELDASSDTLSKKVRTAQTDKVPSLLVLGEKEQADGTVTWRRHGSREQVTMPLDAARDQLLAEIRDRIDWRTGK